MTAWWGQAAAFPWGPQPSTDFPFLRRVHLKPHPGCLPGALCLARPPVLTVELRSQVCPDTSTYSCAGLLVSPLCKLTLSTGNLEGNLGLPWPNLPLYRWGGGACSGDQKIGIHSLLWTPPFPHHVTHSFPFPPCLYFLSSSPRPFPFSLVLIYLSMCLYRTQLLAQWPRLLPTGEGASRATLTSGVDDSWVALLTLTRVFFTSHPSLCLSVPGIVPFTPHPPFTGTRRLPGTHLLKGAFTLEVLGP